MEQGGKSPFSLLSEPISPSCLLFEPISPSSLKFNYFFSPSSLLFPPISPSSQLFLGHFSLLPILFLPPLLSTTFYDICSGMQRNQNFVFGLKSDLCLKAFRFFKIVFAPFLFSPFVIFFAAVIDILLGLLPVQKLLRKRRHRDAQILTWSSLVNSQAILH